MSKNLRHRNRLAEDSSSHNNESSHNSDHDTDSTDMAYARQRPLIAHAVQRTNSNSLPTVGRRLISRDRNNLLLVFAITFIYTTVLYRSGQ